MLVSTPLNSQPGAKRPLSMADEIDLAQLTQWLVAVATTRDKSAFAQLFKFFAPKIQQITSKKYNNDTIASDVVQETMTNVWRKAHLFKPDKGAPTTWVYTVMRNVTFDMFRKVKANKEDHLSDDIWPLVEVNEEPESVFDDHLAKRNMLDLVNKLPPNQQEVVRGFYFLELSQEQLATKLNLPLGTIKSRLRLALAKLKHHIGDDHD